MDPPESIETRLLVYYIIYFGLCSCMERRIWYLFFIYFSLYGTPINTSIKCVFPTGFPPALKLTVNVVYGVPHRCTFRLIRLTLVMWPLSVDHWTTSATGQVSVLTCARNASQIGIFAMSCRFHFNHLLADYLDDTTVPSSGHFYIVCVAIIYNKVIFSYLYRNVLKLKLPFFYLSPLVIVITHHTAWTFSKFSNLFYWQIWQWFIR